MSNILFQVSTYAFLWPTTVNKNCDDVSPVFLKYFPENTSVPLAFARKDYEND